MELEELRDELKIISEREYTLVHDTPARLEYYGHPKEIAKVIVKLIEQGKLRYNGVENYTQIIRSLTSVIDVVSVDTGKIVSRETLLTYAKWIRAGELPEDE